MAEHLLRDAHHIPMLNYGATCALLLCAAATVRGVPVALPADPLDPRSDAAPEVRVLEAQLAAAKEKADLEVKLAKSEAKNEAYESKMLAMKAEAKLALLESKLGAPTA